MAAQALASAGFFVSVPIFTAPAFDLVAKWGRAIHAIQVKSEALHDNQKTIQWMTHTPSGFYTEEDCSYFALVLILRDVIWWVPVAEEAGKKPICTNAEKYAATVSRQTEPTKGIKSGTKSGIKISY